MMLKVGAAGCGGPCAARGRFLPAATGQREVSGKKPATVSARQTKNGPADLMNR